MAPKRTRSRKSVGKVGRKPRGSNFPEIEQVLVAIVEDAEKRNHTVGRWYITEVARELAGELGIVSFKGGDNWFRLFQKRLGKKLSVVPKPRIHWERSKFERLTFGQRHEIVNFLRENVNISHGECAQIFTIKWNRKVTRR